MARAKTPNGKRILQLTIPPQEYERIVTAADARGLGDQSFILMVVMGAIAQGGGTLDRLVQVGSRVIPARKRNERNFEKEWQRGPDGAWHWDKWRLVKRNPKQAKNKDDMNNWWSLRHVDYPLFRRPVAFLWEDAIREAGNLIVNGLRPDASQHPRSERPA